MKITLNFFALVLLTVLVSSCDNESIDNFTTDNEQLVSINEVVKINNDPVGVNYRYTLNNNLNTEIESDIGSSQVQTFEDGKIVLIEYYNDGTLRGLETYDYDPDDRIINIAGDFSNNIQDFNRSYEYIDNEIFHTRTTYNEDGSIANENDLVFNLNGDNQIIRCMSLDNETSWEASYENGNLVNFIAYNGSEIKGTASFVYTSELASEPYQKERYRFGPEWRNNIMLSQIGEYAFKQLAELGTNYLSGYTYTLMSDNTTITLTASYEFDEQERLIKQNKNKMFFMTPIDRVLTYQYQ
ncbi:hypothetical protein [Winogradskyella ursingii]|uniref:hypothetical protein n=1 Tax=Winogradskyella ursingii TaxID=2686079 RepID=UPI0015CA2B40|nr:hypothetical protein [Winogradskyella ursingii]